MKTRPANSQERAGSDFKAIRSRLDAIVLLLLKQNMSADNGRLIVSEVAPLLHRAGYTPTEIAVLFGKKKATEVSQFIYPKKK